METNTEQRVYEEQILAWTDDEIRSKSNEELLEAARYLRSILNSFFLVSQLTKWGHQIQLLEDVVMLRNHLLRDHLLYDKTK